MSSTLLLVEPHPIVRTSLLSRLAEMPGVVLVGGAGQESEAVAMARAHRPDVVLLEPKQLDAVPLVRKLRALCPRSRLIIYTTFLDLQEMAALAPYVDAYLLKSFNLGELQTHVAAGEPRAAPAAKGGVR